MAGWPRHAGMCRPADGWGPCGSAYCRLVSMPFICSELKPGDVEQIDAYSTLCDARGQQLSELLSLPGTAPGCRVELAPEMGGREGIRARESTHLTLQTKGTQGIRMRMVPRGAAGAAGKAAQPAAYLAASGSQAAWPAA